MCNNLGNAPIVTFAKDQPPQLVLFNTINTINDKELTECESELRLENGAPRLFFFCVGLTDHVYFFFVGGL